MNLRDLISSISIFLSTLSKRQTKILISRKRLRTGKESLTRILAAIIWFYYSKIKHFKAYFDSFLILSLQFKISYKTFISYKNRMRDLLCLYLNAISITNIKSNYYIIDSTKIDIDKKVKRFNRLKRGYSSTGSFYGFKLHLVIDEYNFIRNYFISEANYSDVNYLKRIFNGYMNKVLLGDKGYNFSGMPDSFIVKPKNNQNKFLSDRQIALYRKRMNIERFFNVYKNNYCFDPMLCKNSNSLQIMIYSILICSQIIQLSKL